MDALEPLYGHLREDRRRRVWIDKVSLSQICSDAWLVKFDKWESSGELLHHLCSNRFALDHLYSPNYRQYYLYIEPYSMLVR